MSERPSDIRPDGNTITSGAITSGERVMLVIVTLALAGTCLLISSGEGTEEGHQAWRSGSILRALTTLMVLDFQYPTRQGVEIKWLVQGLAAAAGLFSTVLFWYLRTTRDDNAFGIPSDTSMQLSTIEMPSGHRSSKLTTANVAQWALLGFTGWMILSSLWAPWPAASFGEGLRQLMLTVWAIALGRTLGHRTVQKAALALTVILIVTAIIGIWYHIERAPYQRLKFPIGNPIFFAACLLPGITLTVSLIFGGVAGRLDPRVGTRSFHGLVWSAMAGAGLVACLWAFYWADSRGPQLGLIVGFIGAACLFVTGRLRRMIVLFMVLLVVGVAAYIQFVGWPEMIIRRMDTAMLRLYGWSYALTLFMARPILGQGQAGYLLMAHAMSRPDAEQYPGAFVGDLMGHAHSEWLEIMADLGLVGFTLIVLTLVCTCWAGASALRMTGREPGKNMVRWIVFGLLAAFLGIAACEATDVGLRMPGLPMIFYTTMGLLWAASRPETTISFRPAIGYAKGWRVGGLALSAIASFVLLAASVRDWHGALADPQVNKMAAKFQWDDALMRADYARHHRLSVEARLAADYLGNLVSYQAAAHRFQQTQGTLERLEGPHRPSTNILELVHEDTAVFDFYAEHGLEYGGHLMDVMPCYPHVARRMAEILVLKQQLEDIQVKLNLRKETHSYLPGIQHLLQAEYERNRLDPETALRLFEFSGNRSLAERLDILRPPLRSGPEWPSPEQVDGHIHLDLFGEFNLALSTVIDDSGLDAAMTPLISVTGQAALQDISPPQWLDRYLPESLRLAARLKAMAGNYAQAIDLATLAAKLAGKITNRFPTAESCTLIDLSRYMLLGYPEEPQRAVDICRQAIAAWPISGNRLHGRTLKRSLGFYLLAAGDEAAIRQHYLNTGEVKSPQKLEMDHLLALGLNELCQLMASAFAPDHRPQWFSQRMKRALELAPEWPDAHLLAAHLAFEQGRNEEGLVHLEQAERLLDSPSQFQAALAALHRRFPDNNALNEFTKKRLQERTSPQTTTATSISSKNKN